jgi:hypothetical protein
MDDMTQGRAHGGRQDDLPAHEDDSDVASQAGGGVLDEGGTAEVRGTGERTGNAQGLDDETSSSSGGASGGLADAADATPGIRDFADRALAPQDTPLAPGDGAAGTRSGRLHREDDAG